MKYLLYILFSFTFLPLSAQDLAQSLSTQLEEAASQTYMEKIYLHTNSQFLISGEVLYFKVYCVQASNYQASTLGRVAYIELINEANEPVFQSKVELHQGQGSGDFFIPSSLPSGNYTLIAYTKWMRNFEAEKVFQRNITLVNPFQSLENNQPIEASQELNIQFFPEGGQLVQGLENTLAFSVTDSQGKGIHFQGKIVDTAGNVVEEFTPFKPGLGKFTFTPQMGQKYQAIIIDSSEEFHFQEIPPIQARGLALRVNEQSESFALQLQSNFSNDSDEGCVLVYQNNTVFFSAPVRFNNPVESIQIDKKILPPGISTITIFNSLGQPLGERLIFYLPPNYPRLTTLIPSTSLKPRTAVSLDLSIENLPTSAKKAELSISVRKKEPTLGPSSSFRNYLLWHSEVKGQTESLPTYFQNPPASHRQVLDLVMLTQSRQPYAWQSLTQSTTSMPPTHLPDFRGELISGTLKRKDNQSSVADHLVFLSLPARDYQFYASKTDQNGRFYFNTKPIYEDRDMMIQVDNNEEGQYALKLDQDFWRNYTPFSPQRLFLDSTQRALIQNRSIQAQIENAYYTQKSDSIIKLKISKHFYQNPNQVYILEDYTRFPSVVDIIRENIGGVFIRKKKDGYHLSTEAGTVTGIGTSQDALVLLDGLPIADHDAITEYDQANIESIDLVNKRFLYGPLDAKGGVISFHTFKGDLEGFPLNPNLIQKKHLGMQAPKLYYSPVYDSPEAQASRIPDFRTQLYWNPSEQMPLEGSHTITFYTSDDTGNYELCIEGILDTGEPLYLKKSFEVK